MANLQGSDWAYAPPTGGLSNTTTPVTIVAAASGQRQILCGIQIMTDVLGTATELVIRNVTTPSAVLFRTKLPTSGITFGNGMSFDPPLIGNRGEALEMVTLTANGTGAIYVNAQGFTTP